MAEYPLTQNASFWPSFEVHAQDQPLRTRPTTWNATMLLPTDTFLGDVRLSSAWQGGQRTSAHFGPLTLINPNLGYKMLHNVIEKFVYIM